ncbi:UNVERIFIED_CONTAM: hypothetical protein HDU68_007496, partial [Siphonaria sp. JEL0065]
MLRKGSATIVVQQQKEVVKPKDAVSVLKEGQEITSFGAESFQCKHLGCHKTFDTTAKLKTHVSDYHTQAHVIYKDAIAK